LKKHKLSYQKKAIHIVELENCEKTKILIILLTFTQMCLGWLSVEIAPPLSNLVHWGTFGEEDFHLNDLPQKRFV